MRDRDSQPNPSTYRRRRLGAGVLALGVAGTLAAMNLAGGTDGQDNNFQYTKTVQAGDTMESITNNAAEVASAATGQQVTPEEIAPHINVEEAADLNDGRDTDPNDKILSIGEPVTINVPEDKLD